MNRFVTPMLALCALAALIPANAASGQQPYDLVQPKLREFIQSANSAMAQGEFDKAIAYADLVLVQNDIRYSVDYSQIPESQRERASKAVAKAVSLWEQALNAEIRFQEVSPTNANVRIRFEPGIRSSGGEVAGYAVWQRQVNDWGNGRYSLTLSGDIRVRTETPSGKEMSQEALIHAATHEIGHLLGLWDSPNLGDVMGPLHLKQPATQVSDREAAPLREARAEAQAIAQASLMAKNGSR